MLIARQAVAGHAQRMHAPLTGQTKAQQYNQRQCQAIRVQLDWLPTLKLAAHLPTI
tara:strand:- start:398 stop:565 length:168 start_codon:yes stop_codon:yes gene_type:complete